MSLSYSSHFSSSPNLSLADVTQAMVIIPCLSGARHDFSYQFLSGSRAIALSFVKKALCCSWFVWRSLTVISVRRSSLAVYLVRPWPVFLHTSPVGVVKRIAGLPSHVKVAAYPLFFVYVQSRGLRLESSRALVTAIRDYRHGYDAILVFAPRMFIASFLRRPYVATHRFIQTTDVFSWHFVGATRFTQRF